VEEDPVKHFIRPMVLPIVIDVHDINIVDHVKIDEEANRENQVEGKI
jgi:hypothetical protein